MSMTTHDRAPHTLARRGGPKTSQNAAQRVAEFARHHRAQILQVLTMHPHVIGHRSRIGLLDRLVDHMKGKPGVWFGTHEEVARWCARQAGMATKA